MSGGWKDLMEILHVNHTQFGVKLTSPVDSRMKGLLVGASLLLVSTASIHSVRLIQVENSVSFCSSISVTLTGRFHAGIWIRS